MESGSNFILLAEKLNQNCLNNRIFEDKISFWLPWHDYELSTDIEKCRDFCLKKNIMMTTIYLIAIVKIVKKLWKKKFVLFITKLQWKKYNLK